MSGPDSVDELVNTLRAAIRDINARRVVADSVSTLYLTKPSLTRSTILQIEKLLSGLGTTSILAPQVPVTKRGFGGPARSTPTT